VISLAWSRLLEFLTAATNLGLYPLGEDMLAYSVADASTASRQCCLLHTIVITSVYINGSEWRYHDYMLIVSFLIR